MTTYVELSVNQGADFSAQFNLVNKDKSPKNLSGYSAEAKMKRSYTASDSSAIPFVTYIDSAESSLTLSLSNITTDALKGNGRYVYDAEISFVDSASATIVERVIEGIVFVKPSATR